MFSADYSLYNKRFDDVYNIGWLSADFDFPKGTVTISTIDKLCILKKRLLTNQTRGIFRCPFCIEFSGGDYVVNGKHLFLGSAEIWVPDHKNDLVWAAPDLIVHYIYAHNYLPTQHFIDSIDNFDINSTWSSEAFLKDKRSA